MVQVRNFVGFKFLSVLVLDVGVSEFRFGTLILFLIGFGVGWRLWFWGWI